MDPAAAVLQLLTCSRMSSGICMALDLTKYAESMNAAGQRLGCHHSAHETHSRTAEMWALQHPRSAMHVQPQGCEPEPCRQQ